VERLFILAFAAGLARICRPAPAGLTDGALREE